MGLLSGMESLGFQDTKMEIYASETTASNTDVTRKKEEPIASEEECLFHKTYQCPVCDHEFKTLAVRAGHVRNIGQDPDLRPRFRELDSIKYDAIVCPKCGYSALARYYNSVMPMQGRQLRARIMPNFKGIPMREKKLSYDDAILRYKMVLMCDVVGGVKNSRKAYTCLKMAWVIRGKLENEGEIMKPEEKEELQKNELECIQNAYDGYVKAISSENFPLSGMDEPTVIYLLAELAFRLEKYRESLQYLSRILMNTGNSARIKEMALTLKEQIRAQVKPGKA